MELGAALRASGEELHDAFSDAHGLVRRLEPEDRGESRRLRLRIVRSELQLRQAQLASRGDDVVDPLPRRVHLEPVAGIRRHERSPPRMLLDAEVPGRRALENFVKGILVEHDAQVVDAREPPVARLHDHVDGASLQLGEPKLEPVPLEILPGDPRLHRDGLVADAAVAGDQRKPELPDVAGLDLAQLARDQVVVEEVHALSLPSDVDAPSLLGPWTFEPLQLIPTIAVAALYYRRTRTLAERGQPVAIWRRVSFWTSIGLVLLALNSPIDALG